MSQSYLKLTVLFLGLLTLTACESTLEALGGEGGIFGRQPAIDESRAEPDAESVETLLRMGEFSEERGDIAGAIAIYRRARAAAPDWSEPLVRLGRTLMQAGATEQALGAYRDAVVRAPQDTEALRGLANAQIALGEPEGALPLLRDALQVYDERGSQPSPAIYNSQGVAFDLVGDHGQAQTAYRRGLEIDGRDMDLRMNLAVSMSLSGNIAGALELAQAVGQSPASTPRHRQNYSMLLTFAGDLDAARRVARQDMDDRQAAMAVNRFMIIGQIENTAQRAAAISAY